MTRDDIILMADASGLSFYGMGKDRDKFLHYLEAFAKLVAQRPWVGLEPEEILDLFDRNNVYGSKWIEFARTVEDKLKERNT